MDVVSGVCVNAVTRMSVAPNEFPALGDYAVDDCVGEAICMVRSVDVGLLM